MAGSRFLLTLGALAAVSSCPGNLRIGMRTGRRPKAMGLLAILLSATSSTTLAAFTCQGGARPGETIAAFVGVRSGSQVQAVCACREQNES